MKKGISSRRNVSDKDKHKLLDADKFKTLESLFLMDGITPYQAAKIVGISYNTARLYFKDWAEELTEDEAHETWAMREKRVRARALEGIAKKIVAASERLRHIERIYGNIILKKDPKNSKKLITKHPNEIDPVLSSIYEKQIRMTEIFLTELQQQFDGIEMMPPAEAILERELEKLVAEKQAVLNEATTE